MSYVHRNSRVGLGGIMDVAKAATAIVEDPCLGPVATLVLRLHAATPDPTQPRPLPGQPKPPSRPPAKGIGLCNAVTPLKALVWVRERPWVVPVGLAAVVGGIFFAGFATGRGGRR